MSLSVLIFLPLVFAMLLALLPGHKTRLIHFSATGSFLLLFVLTIISWLASRNDPSLFYETLTWLPSFGIQYKVGADSLSWMLALLTTFLMVMASLASLTSIGHRVKLYYFMLFVLTTSLLGVFFARDLFCYFLFWELELIPMYLLISIWGGARRDYAAIKFVLYTFFGSVFMLASVVMLAYFAYKITGTISFDFNVLSRLVVLKPDVFTLGTQVLLFLGFFVAFAIKLPMVPFHTWLPDAHVEAPTPVSMLLAGIMLKMGAYGLLRFCFGWFIDAGSFLSPYIVILAAINIVYTAGIAMVQTDLKKLVAYSSVSHMGFVLLGLGALNQVGFNGAVFQMLSHGIISAGLFMIVGTVYTRTHTRMIAELGGLGKVMPAIYFFALLIAMSSLGLPLLAGFPAETLVLYGSYISFAFNTIPWFNGHTLHITIQMLTIVCAIGTVLGAAYLLLMLQRVFMGKIYPKWESLVDILPSEAIVLSALSFLIIAFGLFPQALVKHFEPEVSTMAVPYMSLAPASQPKQMQPTRHLSANAQRAVESEVR